MDRPTEALAREEANAMVKLLEGSTRKLLVVAVASDGQHITITSAVSAGTTTQDVSNFVQGLDTERGRIAEILGRYI